MNHRAKRRDANEPAIVAALEAAGAVVQRLDDGGGVPDLLVAYAGRTHLLEVKNPDAKGGAKVGGERTKGRGALTPDQVTWFAQWARAGEDVHEVVDPVEALRAIGAML